MNSRVPQPADGGLRNEEFRCGLVLPSFLTAVEVAGLLRTSRKAIYAMLDRGQIPGAVRIGRRVLFSREALLGWLTECRAPSPKEGW